MQVVKNRRSKIFIPVIIIVLLLVCGFGYFQYSVSKTNKEYEIKLKNADILISRQINNSKEMIDKYIEQWEYANGGGQIINMDEGGIVLSGAEEIVNNQMKIFDKQGKVNSLNINKLEITKEMQKLNNPPKRFQEQYVILSELYLNYGEYMQLALSPKGTISEYKEKTDNLYTQIQNNQSELQIKLP
jgi:hypothetical protein